MKRRDDTTEYDIIIAGAGPAGLTVAGELNDSDLKILLIESGEIKKPQNMWVTWTKSAKDTGLGKSIIHNCKHTTFTVLNFSRTVDTDLAMLDENKLIKDMLKKCSDAKVIEGCRFISYRKAGKKATDGLYVQTSRGEFRTKMLIDCTGSNGPTAVQDRSRRKNIVLRIVFKKYKNFSMPNLKPDTAILFDLAYKEKNKPFFFVAVDKKKTGMICLNYFLPKDTTISRDEMERQIDRYIKLRGVKGKEIASHSGDEEMFNHQKTYDDNMLLVGDAAGQADPKAAFALVTTIRFARIAAHNIIQAFKDNRFDKRYLKRYQDEWFRTVKAQLLFGRIHALFFHRATPEILEENLRYLWKMHTEGIYDDGMILRSQNVTMTLDDIATYLRIMRKRSGILEPLKMFTLRDWISILRCIIPLRVMLYMHKKHKHKH